MDALCFFCILMYYFTVIIWYIVQIIIKKNTIGEIAHAYVLFLYLTILYILKYH